MSRDVVQKLVDNKDKWNNNVMEDNAISQLAEELHIPMQSKIRAASINMMTDGNYTCLTYNHGESFICPRLVEIRDKLDGHFFIRVKQDGRRHEDVRIMRELQEHFK